MGNAVLKKTETIAKPAPIKGASDEKKPVLLGQTRSIKIVDLQVRKRRRNPANCKYCNLPIESRYALSKGSRTGARYYHIECAIRVGFDITV
ncbi:MAG: hypothetical protein M1587_02755 [Thaumarchaeota archaeon]|nr:hypothetical protein [Nitrososphaerota archaeon]